MLHRQIRKSNDQYYKQLFKSGKADHLEFTNQTEYSIQHIHQNYNEVPEGEE